MQYKETYQRNRKQSLKGGKREKDFASAMGRGAIDLEDEDFVVEDLESLVGQPRPRKEFKLNETQKDQLKKTNDKIDEELK